MSLNNTFFITLYKENKMATLVSPTQQSIRVKTWIGIALCVFTLVCIAIAWEILYVRRNRLLRSIGSMVGSHLVASREAAASSGVGIGSMPIQMLDRGMNHGVHTSNSVKAKEDLESMLRMVSEAKRRNFLLPLTNKEIAQTIIKWSTTGTQTGEIALKLLPYIMERHAQHMDQMVAQSYVNISDSDPAAATNAMRTLAHQLDTANAAGISVDPAMVLFNPNKATVAMWADQQTQLQPQAAARGLLDSIKEAIDIKIENSRETRSANDSAAAQYNF
jgi:hypothetical protein